MDVLLTLQDFSPHQRSRPFRMKLGNYAPSLCEEDGCLMGLLGKVPYDSGKLI